MVSSKNIPLILGISIPILMVIFIAASIYLPGIFIKPKYNFLYESSNSYQKEYTVQDQKLNKISNSYNLSNNPSIQPAKLYVYDLEDKKSTEISFDQGRKYKLTSDPVSPDKFEIVRGTSSGGFFPFFFYTGSDYNSYYIKGYNVSQKLNLVINGSYYDSYHFLGWILNE